MSLGAWHDVLGIAHDLVCSVLLFMIFMAQLRLHNENRRRLDQIQRRLGLRSGDLNGD